MSYLHYVFIILVICARTVAESRERTFWVVPDQVRSGLQYKITRATDIEHCAKQCMGDGLCRGANFRSSQRSCAMKGEDPSDNPSSFASEPGSFFIGANGYQQSAGAPGSSGIRSPLKPRPAPKSCTELHDKGLFSGDGTYPLYWDGKRTARVYCQMTSIPECGPGPWTLALKIDGSKPTFKYESSLWTNKEPYNLPGADSAFDLQETKCPVFWNAKLTRLCVGMRTNKFISWVTINHTASSLLAVFKGGYQPTNLGRAKWFSLVPNPALQKYCNKEGFNFGRYKWQIIRLGILGNQEKNCYTPDSFVGFGSSFDESVSCGNYAGYNNDNGGDRRTKSFGYILVQ